MSTGGMNEVTIEDEEGIVDRKVKEHVLNLRQQVDEDERLIYVERRSDPHNPLSVAEANQYWGITVRQFLRGIKRLWTKDKTAVTNVQKYWEEQKIGEETLIPPDKGDYRFSLTAYDQYSESELKRLIGLPKKSELPEPKTVEFHGLNSVLNQNRIQQTWLVKTDMRGPPPTHKSMTLSAEMPLPKHILENAVEAADNFLQQAGLGFEVGVPDWRSTEPGL